MTSTPASPLSSGDGQLVATCPVPKKTKLHGRAFYESIGSPKYVLAPMVDQSEFAWRMLTRSFMTPTENAKLLAYTPMLHARLYRETDKYRESHFQPTRQDSSNAKQKADPSSLPSISQSANLPPIPYLDGNPALDRPLFVQFCANDPQYLFDAATLVAPHCDAVDLNLGCPQGIARKGHYGAFLQEDQDLVYRLINILHENLPVPVTAKLRILETKEATLAYAKNVLDAGASIITVHGRRREQKGHLTGVADWEYLRYLRENLPKDTVIFANGSILQHGDLEPCLEATGADAVMSAEGNLSDPAIFAQVPPVGHEGREYWRGREGKGGFRVDAIFRRYMDIIHQYVLRQEPPTRRPLFAVGDDENWLKETREKDAAEEQEYVPARKKRKKNHDNGGGKRPERMNSPNLVVIRPHLFHLLRHFVAVHTDIRDALAKSIGADIDSIERILEMVERRIAEGLIEYERTGGKSIAEEPKKPSRSSVTSPKLDGAEGVNDLEEDDPESSLAAVRRCKRPWWIAQPIVRPLPKEALAKGSIQFSKKEMKKQQKQHGENAASVITTTTTADGPNHIDGKGVPTAKEEVEKKSRVNMDVLPKADGVEGTKEPTMDTKAPGLTSDELICG